MIPAALAAGLAVTGAILAVVVWGRFRRVVVPRPRRWVGRGPRVWCGDDALEEAVQEALWWWHARGYDIGWAHDVVSATVTIWTDPALDDRGSVDDAAPSRWGVASVRTDADGVTLGADVRMAPGAGALAVAHEVGHVLGFEHPRLAPGGHMMNPTRPGWDGRGLEAP